MKTIFKHTSKQGHTVEVMDAATLPVQFLIRCDEPGQRAVSCLVPENFFANMVNVINLGPNYADLPGTPPAA